MKKIIFCLFILLVAVTGCKFKSKNKLESNDVEATYSINYNDDFYKIHKPYKKGVGKNYILNSNVVDYDVTTIEKGLIQISTNTFDVDKYYYEEGQYLTKSKLKDLLSKKELNDYGKKKINGKNVGEYSTKEKYEYIDRNGAKESVYEKSVSGSPRVTEIISPSLSFRLLGIPCTTSSLIEVHSDAGNPS